MYINFNTGAAAAILSMNSLYAQLQQTETQISTNKAINSPADNPVVWAEASRMESSAGMWGAVANEIANGSSAELTTATSALSSVISTLDSMQTKLQDVQANPNDATTALAALQQYGQTLLTLVGGAVSSNGVNLLDGSTGGSASLIEGYNSNGSVRTFAFTTQALTGGAGLLQVAQATTSTTSTDFTALVANDLSVGTIGTTLANITKAIADVTGYSESVGATSSSETTMQTFARTMQTNMQNGVDALTAADTAALQVKQSALQTQLQLATASLLVSEAVSQYVLKLFP